MSSASPEQDTPVVVRDLADSCVRFVQRALRVELEYTPETLPILDHYLREAHGIEREEVLNLVAPRASDWLQWRISRRFPDSRAASRHAERDRLTG